MWIQFACSRLCLMVHFSQVKKQNLGANLYFYTIVGRYLNDFRLNWTQICSFYFSCMEHFGAAQSVQDENPSLPSSSSPSPPSPLTLRPITSTSSPLASILKQSHNSQIQNYDSLSQAIPKVPSNASLERVITSSKMAALQSRRGSNSSLANLRNSLLEEENPRRGSAVGMQVNILFIKPGIILLPDPRELWPACSPGFSKVWRIFSLPARLQGRECERLWQELSCPSPSKVLGRWGPGKQAW